jgi:hypothetical protein
MMKKLSFLLAVAFAASLTSCSIPARLTNTAAYVENEATKPIAAVYADIEVSPKKVKYTYIPKETVKNGGAENVINTAVREALIANDNADLMICLEKQIKYNNLGEIESVTISGYPAHYKNFRSPSDEHLLEILKHGSKANKQEGDSGVIANFKLK